MQGKNAQSVFVFVFVFLLFFYFPTWHCFPRNLCQLHKLSCPIEMSSRKRKGSQTYLSLYKTKFLRKSKDSGSVTSSQWSMSSQNSFEDNVDHYHVKHFHVSSVQTDMDIRLTKTQTEHPKYKSSYLTNRDCTMYI